MLIKIFILNSCFKNLQTPIPHHSNTLLISFYLLTKKKNCFTFLYFLDKKKNVIFSRTTLAPLHFRPGTIPYRSPPQSKPVALTQMPPRRGARGAAPRGVATSSPWPSAVCQIERFPHTPHVLNKLISITQSTPKPYVISVINVSNV